MTSVRSTRERSSKSDRDDLPEAYWRREVYHVRRHPGGLRCASMRITRASSHLLQNFPFSLARAYTTQIAAASRRLRQLQDLSLGWERCTTSPPSAKLATTDLDVGRRSSCNAVKLRTSGPSPRDGARRSSTKEVRASSSSCPSANVQAYGRCCRANLGLDIRALLHASSPPPVAVRPVYARAGSTGRSSMPCPGGSP